MKLLLRNDFLRYRQCNNSCWGKPVLVDIDPNSGTLIVTKLEEKNYTQNKAIIPVHFAGRVV